MTKETRKSIETAAWTGHADGELLDAAAFDQDRLIAVYAWRSILSDSFSQIDRFCPFLRYFKKSMYSFMTLNISPDRITKGWKSVSSSP